MIGLYAGLRREEILGLKWDCVFLDTETPYLSVRRAWHVEHNRPIISTELKTNAVRRDVPLPAQLAECLREAKTMSKSEFVIANSDGQPLLYSIPACLEIYRDTLQQRKVICQIFKWTENRSLRHTSSG